MYIQPNTTIKFYSNIPLDVSYTDTLYFANVGAQNTYFHGGGHNPKYTLGNNTYQRVEKGKMRVGIKSDNLYDCNYIAFQNTSYGTKWFYAFITGVEYVNNETSEVSFQIDVLQTYLFDVTLDYCFIEREHSSTDSINDWLVPESIETGDYIIDDENFLSFGTSRIAMYSSFNPKDLERQPMEYNPNQGLMSGLGATAYALSPEGAEQLSADLGYIAEKGELDAIVDLVLTPLCCASIKSQHNYTLTINRPTTIDGYTPKNKKLFTAPYCQLLVDNNSGGTAVYNFEYFQSTAGTVLNSITLEAIGNLIPMPTVWCVPKNYKGVDYNYNEALVTSGFLSVPYQVDVYKQWLAQNKNTLAVAGSIAGIEAGVGIVKLAATEGAMGGQELATGVGAIAGIIGRIKDHKVGSVQSRGRCSGDGLLPALDLVGCKVYTETVTKQMAIVIDDFFNKFGYACHKVKRPNVAIGGNSIRPYWNYIKTIGCNAHGRCPADDLAKIKEIYNNGITFWTNANQVGQYSLDNSPQL